MEFLLFLNPREVEIIELITKANYSIEENTPLCLIGKNYFGFLKNKQKTVVICTENAKRYSGYYLPKIVKNDNYDKTGLYIRKALRHEAVHIAQNCNNGNLIAIKKYSPEFNSSKLRALKNSTLISGSEDKEHEAYYLQEKPKLVIKALKKYCF